ncbi:hypothetical protein [Specibacter sp. NPDC078709]|uniref:hypothetical protein n=1 Tax=Specibacter sp. NPDC078709 TaxID=3154364 RepID=UPI0034366102
MSPKSTNGVAEGSVVGLAATAGELGAGLDGPTGLGTVLAGAEGEAAGALVAEGCTELVAGAVVASVAWVLPEQAASARTTVDSAAILNTFFTLRLRG